jgi:hypothetical protein
MISFDKPKELNGAQLCEELQAAGIAIDEKKNPYIDGNGVFWLDIASKDTQKAQDILNAHIPKPKPKLTIDDKLASVGLSIDDLKTALGL